MKKLLFTFLFFYAFSCQKVKRKFPIDDISKVEIYSYYDRTSWDTVKVNEKAPLYKELIKEGKLTFNTAFIKEKIILNKNQQKELVNLMVCDTCIPSELPAACYMPRHLILFKHANNKILGYNEFCFECIGSRQSKNLENFQKFCLNDMSLLFKKFGIKFFGNTREQIHEEYKFADSIIKVRYPKLKE